MGNQKYFDMLYEMRSVTFSTVDDANHPKSRIIDVMFIEDEKIYFLAARGKNFYQELITRKEVAITGLNKQWKSIRIQGKVRKVEQHYLEQIFDLHKNMGRLYPGVSRNILEVFCLYEGTGELFDISNHPIQRESFSFGGSKLKQEGFYISAQCISCGRCKQACPQQCIEHGTPFTITQRNCLRCGLCQEVCPFNAIERFI